MKSIRLKEKVNETAAIKCLKVPNLRTFRLEKLTLDQNLMNLLIENLCPLYIEELEFLNIQLENPIIDSFVSFLSNFESLKILSFKGVNNWELI